MKYGYEEVRKLHWEDLRTLCISENWYTCGTNEEYENLFEMTKKENITTDDIVEIATDIYEHSNTDKIKYETGMDMGEILTAIMFEVNKACHTFFKEV